MQQFKNLTGAAEVEASTGKPQSVEPPNETRKKPRKPSRVAIAKLFRLFKAQWGTKWASRFTDADDYDAAIDVWQGTLVGHGDDDVLAGFWRAKALFTWPPLPDEYSELLRAPQVRPTKTYASYIPIAGRLHGVTGWDVTQGCYTIEDAGNGRKGLWWPDGRVELEPYVA